MDLYRLLITHRTGWSYVAVGLLSPLVGYGVLLLWESVTRGRSRWAGRLLPGSLRARLLVGLLQLALLPALGITLTLFQRQATQYEDQSRRQVVDLARSLSLQTDEFLDRHTQGVRSAAESIQLDGRPDPARIAEWLDRFHRVYGDFLTMLAADGRGQIVAATRRQEGYVTAASSSFDGVADREYFREPMRTGQAYLSRVFQGRGLGHDPIVAVSAPITIQGARWGVVEGSLDLRVFARFEEQSTSLIGGELVILDDRHQVIFASRATGLKVLQDLTDTPLLAAVRSQAARAVVVPVTGAAAQSTSFLGAGHLTRQGWQVIVLRPERGVLAALRQQMTATLGWLMASVVSALLVAAALGRGVSSPLRHLQQSIIDYRLDGPPGRFGRLRGLTSEYRKVFRHLHRMSWHLRRNYQQLMTALADMRQLRDELAGVLARREEEVRVRTSELAAANAALERLARIDPLTGLANRRQFGEALEQSWRLGMRNGTPVSLMLVDVDHFKGYNDSYGHQAGDECLARVATTLASVARRPLDAVARYGGEEFSVVLTDTSAHGAVRVAERMRTSVTALAIAHRASPFGHVTVSIGVVTVVPAGEDRAESFLARADEALYRAKAAGRDRVACWQTGGHLRVLPDTEEDRSFPRAETG